MQELIGYYIPMEEYYMRESVNKVHFGIYCILYPRIFLIFHYFSPSNKFRNQMYTCPLNENNCQLLKNKFSSFLWQSMLKK